MTAVPSPCELRAIRVREVGTTAIRVIVLVVATAAALCAQTDPAFNADFDVADRRAQTLAWTVECYSRFGLLLQSYRIASNPTRESLGPANVCFTDGGRRVLANLSVDAAARRLTKLLVVDLGTGAAVTTPLDTARLVNEAIAEEAAVARNVGMPDSVSAGYMPFSMRFDGDTIEVWMVKRDVFDFRQLRVGGELGYIFSPDGRTLVREVGTVQSYRQLGGPASQSTTIESREARIPSLSELLVANMLASRGAQVTIQTASRASTLMPGGTMWMHRPR